MKYRARIGHSLTSEVVCLVMSECDRLVTEHPACVVLAVTSGTISPRPAAAVTESVAPVSRCATFQSAAARLAEMINSYTLGSEFSNYHVYPK